MQKMTQTYYVFSRDAGPEDWRALPRMFKMGDQVRRFTGHDYGLARDDMMYLGVETISCTEDEDGGTPSFTVPCDYLLTAEGERPMGEYIKLPARAPR
jgi:hypothetical protein